MCPLMSQSLLWYNTKIKDIGTVLIRRFTASVKGFRNFSSRPILLPYTDVCVYVCVCVRARAYVCLIAVVCNNSAARQRDDRERIQPRTPSLPHPLLPYITPSIDPSEGRTRHPLRFSRRTRRQNAALSQDQEIIEPGTPHLRSPNPTPCPNPH